MIRRVTLTNFRNYRVAALTAGDKPIVLSGPNGAGKTNLLEAISFLAPGRGLRRAKLSEIDRRGGSGAWTISVQLATADGLLQIGTGRDDASDSGERRIVRIDGAAAKSQAEL